jgi:hypothetical protein
LQVVSTELAITKDLREQTRTNGFAGVDRDDRASPVRVAQEMVASARTHDFNSGLLQ